LTTARALVRKLDLATCPELEEALESTEGIAGATVVLDLRGLTFIDSSGIRVLLLAIERNRANGDHLRVIPSRHDQVETVLKVTHVEAMLPLAEEPSA
jgi:anti-sigma B factor antagonist